MADKTQINLERIRACDAEWEESKHPRSENGQFTSGSGAHVSKIQSGGKAKVQQRPKIQAMRQLAQAAAAKPAPAPAAKPTLQKLQQAMHSSSMMGDRAWLHLDGQDYVKIGRDKWEHHPSNSHALGGTYSSQQMMEKIGKAKKVDLYEPSAPAKPQPKAAQPAAKPAKPAKPAKSTAQLENEYKDAFNRYVAFTENAAGLHDLYRNPEIYKQAMQIAKKKAQKAEKAYMKAVEKEEKQAKAGGGLESYKYKPPSKLEGFPIVMASKKTNSGLGGGNRFKFGFKKYKDGIMIRYVDDYWDSSDYAFVPLKNPTLENAYSYSDNASSKTVSALKDSLVTNEELGKIARQLK